MDSTFSAEDLFLGFNRKFRQQEKILKHYTDIKTFGSKIFMHTLHFILLDIIENNAIFVLPLRFGNYAEISMKTIADEDFIEAYKNGAFQSNDFLETNYTENRLYFYWKQKKTDKYIHKPIYPLGLFAKEIKRLTKLGKRYN